MAVAKKSGLDPFTRQIHFVKRGGVGTIQTGIDGYRAIAERSGTLAGIDDAVYDDEISDHPQKASVTVYKLQGGVKTSFTASARWSEYNQATSPIWKKMPYLMLGKCAEALALRKAFPNDLSGLYTNEEMAQADNEPVRAQVIEPATPTPAPAPLDFTPDQERELIFRLVEVLKPDIQKEYIVQFIVDEAGVAVVPENFKKIITEREKKVEAKKKASGSRLAKTIAKDSGQDEDYGMEKFAPNDLPEIQADQE